MIVLFGVPADSLDEANLLVESTLGQKMEAREGLHSGGGYFLFRGTEYSIMLRENIDLDDIEHEFDGLHEPTFAAFRWLLYVEGISIPTRVLVALEGQSEKFIKLRTT